MDCKIAMMGGYEARERALINDPKRFSVGDLIESCTTISGTKGGNKFDRCAPDYIVVAIHVDEKTMFLQQINAKTKEPLPHKWGVYPMNSDQIRKWNE